MKEATNVYRTFAKAWLRIYGPPSVLVVDAGLEFRGLQGTVMHRIDLQRLGLQGTVMHRIDTRSPWQNAKTEHYGGLLKEQLKMARDEADPQNEDELNVLKDGCLSTKNMYTNRSGFSPMQRVYGYTHRLPSTLTSDDAIEAHMLPYSSIREHQRALE